MTPERWNKIKDLFSSAQDVADDERDQFLIRACGGDEELRGEVEKLLDSHREDDSFLQDSAVAEAASLFDDDDDAGPGPAETDAPPRFDAGIVLNERYEIVRLLGRGGMGEVYLAADTRINRNVALKVLQPELVSSKESLRRFALEAQAVSALNHPHIMTIHEFDKTSDGALFFVAEFVDGKTLNHLIGSGLDPGKALDIAIQVSSALSAAHEAGITHRDIKPENIMVREDGYIKVLDFGLAKLAQRRHPSNSAGSEDPTQALPRTRPGAVMGTAAYMSPEQARGLHVDARTDIWSLGVVLYEMFTGQRPFSGETSADVMVSVLLREPPPMSSYVGNLPAELEWMVSKALSKNIEGRYQTSKELRADLDKIKKRIEFDESLSNSFDDNIASRVRLGGITAGNEGRPTSGGKDDVAAPRSFLSAPSFQAVVRQAQTHKVGSSVVGLALVALVSAAVYFAFVATPASAQIDSIAVLPFENVGGNPELAYAADGLSEALRDRLSQLPQLKVISRSSSFKFRGPDVDVRSAAAQLGVRAIVMGKVTQQGDYIEIRVELIDAVENTQLWGDQYRRKATDIAGTHAEIARAAAEGLRMNFGAGPMARLSDRETENSEAYRFYLSGLVELDGTSKGAQKALKSFQRAVELDPQFAICHANIAWIHWREANAADDPALMMPKAKAAAATALTISPELATAHVVMAMVHEFEFDSAAAESEYRRAIDLSPNLDLARNNYAFFLSVMDRQDEALAQLEEQRERDPLSQRLFYLQKAIVLVQARRFDEALEAYREAQAVDPSKEIPDFALGYAYAGKGLAEQAIVHYRKAVEDLGGDNEYSQPLVYLAATYSKMPEKRNEGRAILTRIEAMNVYKSPALLAIVYSALDDNDKAMELLEQSYIKRDLLLRYIGTGYEYDGLRSDPRFVDLTRRIGLAK